MCAKVVFQAEFGAMNHKITLLRRVQLLDSSDVGKLCGYFVMFYIYMHAFSGSWETSLRANAIITTILLLNYSTLINACFQSCLKKRKMIHKHKLRLIWWNGLRTHNEIIRLLINLKIPTTHNETKAENKQSQGKYVNLYVHSSQFRISIPSASWALIREDAIQTVTGETKRTVSQMI